MFRYIALTALFIIVASLLSSCSSEEPRQIDEVSGYLVEDLDTTNFSMLWWDGTIKGHHAKELGHRVYMLPDVYNESIDRRHLIMSYGRNPSDYWDYGHVKVDEQFIDSLIQNLLGIDTLNR